MSFAEHLAADRRLVILRLLAEAPAYQLNDSVLQAALDGLAHAVSRDAMRSELAWLAEQQLVTVAVERNVVHIAILTERGLDVAAGRAQVPGVKRPAPRRA